MVIQGWMLRLVLHVPRMTGPRSDELERYPRSDRFQRTSQAIGRWRMRDEGQDRSLLRFSHPSIILEETLRSDPNMMNMPKNSGSLLPLWPFHRESFYVTGTHLLDDGTVNPGWIARLSGFFFLELMPGGSQEGRRLEEGQGLCETSSEERLCQGWPTISRQRILPHRRLMVHPLERES